MHQIGLAWHPKRVRKLFFTRGPLNVSGGSGKRHSFSKIAAILWLLTVLIEAPASRAQSAQAPPSTNPQSSEDIPDAPSVVQPPSPKLPQPTDVAPNPPAPESGLEPGRSSSADTALPDDAKPAPPPMPPVETIPPGSVPANASAGRPPKNQVASGDDVYKIPVIVNFVQIPVMVKDKRGRRVDGLLPKDFIVNENGKPQTLTYFTSDAFALSVAIVLDIGMADVSLQRINETYSSLVGAFSPYDEFALYTYSSTVSQVADFTHRPERLTAALDELKLVRGHENGPPVLGGPLAGGPTVNGMPVGGSPTTPVNTPPKEAHVLNDAILRAALDLSRRDRTRRKVILVVSDGQERGSSAHYKEVLRVLETHSIQVKAVVVDQGALPGYKQVERIHHVFDQGYSNILPKYTNATGGGVPYSELTRNAIEDAYASIASEARNVYTLGYNAKPVTGPSAYRSIEVIVLKKGLNIYTKAGYYPVPSAH
jgi:VWFA-related protein